MKAVSTRWRALGSAIESMMALAMMCAVAAYLVFLEPAGEMPHRSRPAPESPPVALTQGNRIRVDPASALARHLKPVTVLRERVAQPLIQVTGTVVASARPGEGGTRIQFHTQELLASFNEWNKAKSDVEFLNTQKASISELAKARSDASRKALERLEKLVVAGTDSEKDLATARADALQGEIQGRKEVYEATSAVLVAKRSETAFARQLELAGLQPGLLESLTADRDLVMADVPEIWYTQVKLGQSCQARFFGLPGRTFPGTVENLPPLVTKDRRSLRVLITLVDPGDILRPGMFAEIDLGTDPREAVRVPAEALVHIGRGDWVAVFTGNPGEYEVREIIPGDSRGDRMEILRGIEPGEIVLGAGTSLLKPYMIDVVRGRQAR